MKGPGSAIAVLALLVLSSAGRTQNNPTSTSVAGMQYRIQPGDTVRSVAGRFNMTAQDFLAQLRKPFRPGQIIFVNPPGKSDPTSVNKDDWYGIVTVNSGDTLESIADKLSVSIEEIGELNDKAITAEVTAGDTLAAIAKRFHVSTDQLANWNECFSTDSLYPGMSLTVGWEKTVAGENLYYPVYSRAIESIHQTIAKKQYASYTVVRGDTVERIATAKGCTARDIRDLNAIGDSEEPKAGELLFVPSAAADKAGGAQQIRGGVALRATTLRHEPGGAPVALVSRGAHLSIVGEWGSGYAVLISGKAYGWIAATEVQLEASAAGAIPNANVNRAIQVAYTYLGVPYHFGGNTYRGIDCSALVKNALVAAGTWKSEAPRVACDQMHVGVPVTPEQLQPGDRVYFYFGRTPPGLADHTALYIGGGQVIQASSSRGVTISCLFSGSLWHNYMGARRDVSPVRVGAL